MAPAPGRRSTRRSRRGRYPGCRDAVAGGQIGAFAGLYALLVGAALGGSVGSGILAASVTNPFGATATVVVGVGMVSVGAILGAEKINELYEACDAEQRRALTDVLAYGARKLWLIRKLLRLAVR